MTRPSSYRVLADPGSGWVLGVRQYHGREGDGFDEFRTGLDHFAFSVENREALEEWERELSARGIAYTPIAETSIGSVIVFRDPDNIQLEFWLPSHLKVRRLTMADRAAQPRSVRREFSRSARRDGHLLVH